MKRHIYKAISILLLLPAVSLAHHGGEPGPVAQLAHVLSDPLHLGLTLLLAGAAALALRGLKRRQGRS